MTLDEAESELKRSEIKNKETGRVVDSQATPATGLSAEPQLCRCDALIGARCGAMAL